MMKIAGLIILSILCTVTLKANKPKTKSQSANYPYIIYLPKDFDHDKEIAWPVIIYLHGRSACGNNLSKVRRYGLPFFTDHGMHLNAIAVSPQCPVGKNWTTDNWLEPMLLELEKKYNIDSNRIYLTGMSLGGFGTWDLAIKYPDKFAAIAPLCGGGRPQAVCAIKDVPVWAFHGDKDEQVPFIRTREMVDALRKCGGNPVFTILKGFPHDIHRTYADENLYKWLLQFSLSTREYTGNLLASKDTVVRELPPVTKYHGMYAQKNNEVKEPVVIAETQIKKSKTVVKKEKISVKKTPKEKIAKNVQQTDTIKGKEFMLVF